MTKNKRFNTYFGSFSDYLEAAVLNHIFGKTTLTAPTNLFVALCTSAPTDADTGATLRSGSKEVPFSNGYTRVSTAHSDWSSAAGTSPTSLTNANDITFPTPTGSWGTITHFAVLDSASDGAGNVLFWGALSQSYPIATGMIVKFLASNLTTTLD